MLGLLLASQEGSQKLQRESYIVTTYYYQISVLSALISPGSWTFRDGSLERLERSATFRDGSLELFPVV